MNDAELEHTKNGMKMCMLHIATLLQNSKLLIKKKRFSAAIPQTILAIEEIGKVHVMSETVKLQKPLSIEIWREITIGGKAHVKKVTSLILSRKLSLENLNPESEHRFDEIMQRIGIPVSDTESSLIDNKIMKIIFLRLERLKQDCFYTGFDFNKQWNNFDNRFSDEIKKAIATCVYVIALRQYVGLKFYLSLPQKSLEEYSPSEKKDMGSRWLKEVGSIMKKTGTKEIGSLTDIAIINLIRTYPADNRGLVTETNGNVFDF